MRTRSAALLLALLFSALCGLAHAQVFPAEFDVATLRAANGGDGSDGFILRGGLRRSDLTGISLSSAGDFNGDNIDDILIGTLWSDQNRAGSAYLVFGSGAGFVPELELFTLLAEQGGDGSRGFAMLGPFDPSVAGSEVAGAGDFNGDGFDDIIIGAPANVFMGTEPGEAIVLFGNPGPHEATLNLATLRPGLGGDGSAGFSATGFEPASATGLGLAGAGDINGDGFHDILIGAFERDARGFPDAGEVYAVYGRPTFPAVLPLVSLFPSQGGDGNAGFVVSGLEANDWLGLALDNAGDINADGRTDFILRAETAGSLSGINYLINGGDDNFPAQFDLGSLYPAVGGDGSVGTVIVDFATDQVDAGNGDVTAAGDVNGDGIDDLIISDPAITVAGQRNVGVLAVVFGKAGGLPARITLNDLLEDNGGDGSDGFLVIGPSGFANLGESAAGPGDVNGDGFDDIVFGMSGVGDSGAAAVLYGRSSFPPNVLAADLFAENGGDGSEGFVIVDSEGVDAIVSDLGRVVTNLGDVNADGIADFALSAPQYELRVEKQNIGETYVIFGRAAEALAQGE